jgi:hypothetical protein
MSVVIDEIANPGNVLWKSFGQKLSTTGLECEVLRISETSKGTNVKIMVIQVYENIIPSIAFQIVSIYICFIAFFFLL